MSPRTGLRTGRGTGLGAGLGAGPGSAGDAESRRIRYALIPLRLFLGITFVYAGLDKLTDPAFLAADGPGSIGELMRAARDTAGLPGLVDLALKNPVGFGWAMALGELAVGVGTLLGIWTRVAAAGGALISLSLWLTVSWAATPYYYGNDLPYLMAWLPLIVAGAPLLSVDGLWARRRRERARRDASFS
ncbi:DoxX family protein [Streptomyces triculaminicus]|uniref:DoxX family protein n=1 Tax=Streptomyces triculaminicus TaxID=2816232 RepID=UPI0033D88B1C